MKEQLLNSSVLETLKELDDGSFFAELLNLFLHHTPLLLDELGRAHRQGDRETIRIIANKLKGSCSNIGAESMASLAHEIEQKTVDHHVCFNVQSEIEQMVADFAIVQSELSRELEVHQRSSRPFADSIEI